MWRIVMTKLKIELFLVLQSHVKKARLERRMAEMFGEKESSDYYYLVSAIQKTNEPKWITLEKFFAYKKSLRHSQSTTGMVPEAQAYCEQNHHGNGHKINMIVPRRKAVHVYPPRILL